MSILAEETTNNEETSIIGSNTMTVELCSSISAALAGSGEEGSSRNSSSISSDIKQCTIVYIKGG